MPADSRCYVGVWDGKAEAVTVINPDRQKETAKEIAKWIREGATIHECSVGHAKKVLMNDWRPETPDAR